MNRIEVLNEDVVGQIAAGEVVERPSHLVKELIENSLDAGSTEVEVEFSEGGRNVTVRDNGSGIHKDDLVLAVTRHATSKIRKSDDLWSLGTFGFRGEALATISAVSDLSVSSKQKLGDGATITTAFGSAPEIIPSGGVEGTVVKVKNLFENVPARLKFLKSQSAEAIQIKRVVKATAIARPDITFRLKQDGRVLAVWPSVAELLTRVKSVLELDEAFEVQEKAGSIDVQIVYTSPDKTVRTSQNIWIFVQDRWVQDRGIQAAVMDAFRNLLMHGEFPSCVVKINLDPSEVDVNVHPTKSQVKFRDNSLIFRAVRGVLRKDLERARWLQRINEKGQGPSPSQNFARGSSNAHYQLSPSNPIGQESFFSSSLESQAAKTNPQSFSQESNLEFQQFDMNRVQFPQKVWQSEENLSQPSESLVFDSHTQSLSTNEGISEPVWSRMQVLGQANLTYIIAQSAHSLVLIDQHAAHERVMFEKLMNGWRKNTIETQRKLIPLTVDLRADLAEAIVGHTESLSRMGFEVELIGPETIAVSSTPSIVSESAIVRVMEKLGNDLLEQGESSAIDKVIGDLMSTMACHSVVRAGQAMSLEQMKSILIQMDEFPLSSFCPHGRPVFVEYRFHELDKAFGRIV